MQNLKHFLSSVKRPWILKFSLYPAILKNVEANSISLVFSGNCESVRAEYEISRIIQRFGEQRGKGWNFRFLKRSSRFIGHAAGISSSASSSLLP